MVDPSQTTQSENKVSWHHKVSQGPTRSHKVAQGLTRSHKVSQGLKRSHKATQGLTRPHKVSQGLTRPHRVSRGDSQVCSFSVWPLLGTLYHTYVAKTLHTAGNSIESQHGLLVIQWSPSMACWSSAERILIYVLCLFLGDSCPADLKR